jgi:hypothetical protein
MTLEKLSVVNGAAVPMINTVLAIIRLTADKRNIHRMDWLKRKEVHVFIQSKFQKLRSLYFTNTDE